MEEFDAHDPQSIELSWRAHDWTADEIQFASQMLQHGDVVRARASIYRESDGSKPSRVTCLRLGEEMLEKPHIRQYIEYVRGKMRASMEVSKERILEELALLAYSNQADFVVIQEDGSFYTDLSGLTREQMAAIQEISVDTYYEGRGEEAVPVKSVKIKLAPKIAALELLGKHKNLWAPDKMGIVGGDGGPLSVTITRFADTEEGKAEAAGNGADNPSE